LGNEEVESLGVGKRGWELISWSAKLDVEQLPCALQCMSTRINEAEMNLGNSLNHDV